MIISNYLIANREIVSYNYLDYLFMNNLRFKRGPVDPTGTKRLGSGESGGGVLAEGSS